MAWAGQICIYVSECVDVVVYGLSYSLAKLASNASLFARGVSPEGVLATESRRDRALNVSVYIFGYRYVFVVVSHTFSKG
jgi:hypothetical protein